MTAAASAEVTAGRSGAAPGAKPHALAQASALVTVSGRDTRGGNEVAAGRSGAAPGAKPHALAQASARTAAPTERSSDNGGVEANAVSATAHALITKQGV